MALWVSCPRVAQQDGTLLAAIALVLGFILHQAFRTAFELFGGWECRLRPVIKTILAMDKKLTPRRAFLVWELTLYSKEIDESFRAHDRGAWHYVMSFWSIAFSSALSFLLMMITAIVRGDWESGSWAIAPFVIGVIFTAKGFLTASSISRQECSILKLCDAFRNTMTKLGTASRELGRP